MARVLDLQSSGLRFKFSTLPFIGFVLGHPKSALCKYPTGLLPGSWDFQALIQAVWFILIGHYQALLDRV